MIALNPILLVGLIRALAISLINIYSNGKERGLFRFTIKYIFIYLVFSMIVGWIIKYGNIEFIDAFNKKYTYNPYPDLILLSTSTITYKTFKTAMLFSYLLLIVKKLLKSETMQEYNNNYNYSLNNRKNKIIVLDNSGRSASYLILFFRDWFNYIVLYTAPFLFLTSIVRKDGKSLTNLIFKTEIRKEGCFVEE